MSEREPRFNPINPENQDDTAKHHVEVATQTDLELLNQTFPPPEDDPEQHKDLLEQQAKGEISFFILHQEDEITGTASLLYDWQSKEYSNIKEPHVMGVQIAEKHKSKHLPDKLLQACDDKARSKGYTKIYTGVDANNRPPAQLHILEPSHSHPGSVTL